MRLESEHTKCLFDQSVELSDHLAHGVAEGQYDRRVVELMAMASAWAYADLQTYTDRLCRRGLQGTCVEVSVKNEALLVDTTAYLFQDEKKRFTILTFRGAGAMNAINWMTDRSAKPVPFLSEGSVHSGIYYGGMAVWRVVKELLAAAYEGADIGARLDELDPKNPAHKPETKLEVINKEKARMQALYIAGHGLGGSLAGLAGAGIYMEPALEGLRKLLRVVTAFGPARFADPALAMALERKMGDKHLWFTYQNDFMTKMAPMTVGQFWHFGRQYVSSGPEGTWVHPSRRMRRDLLSSVLANTVGVLAYIKDNLLLVKNMSMPMSSADHSPLNYLRISQHAYSGFELL